MAIMIDLGEGEGMSQQRQPQLMKCFHTSAAVLIIPAIIPLPWGRCFVEIGEPACFCLNI